MTTGDDDLTDLTDTREDQAIKALYTYAERITRQSVPRLTFLLNHPRWRLRGSVGVVVARVF